MSSTYTPLEVKDIEDIFKTESLDQMTSRPSPGSLITITNQLSRAFQTIHCPYSAFGMLYIVLPPRVYTVITGETVKPPADPGTIPPLPTLIRCIHQPCHPSNMAKPEGGPSKLSPLQSSGHRQNKMGPPIQHSSRTHPTLRGQSQSNICSIL